jgi:hypothetical protein
LDPRAYNLTHEEMKFRIVARDRDTKNMQVVKVDWKDGETFSRNNSHLKDKDLDDTLIHIWRQPGSYPVVARVMDGCGVQDSMELSIELVDNRIPTISVTGSGFNPGTQEYGVFVEASDGDVASGMDSMIVVVTWGAIVETWVHQDNKVLERKYLREPVAIPFKPVPNATDYVIYVTVMDQFRGTASDTLRLTPREAFGLP